MQSKSIFALKNKTMFLIQWLLIVIYELMAHEKYYIFRQVIHLHTNTIIKYTVTECFNRIQGRIIDSSSSFLGCKWA